MSERNEDEEPGEGGPPTQRDIDDAVSTDDGKTFRYGLHAKVVATSPSGLCEWMEGEKYFPDIFKVNERGNVDEIILDCRKFKNKQGKTRFVGTTRLGRGWV